MKDKNERIGWLILTISAALDFGGLMQLNTPIYGGVIWVIFVCLIYYLDVNLMTMITKVVIVVMSTLLSFMFFQTLIDVEKTAYTELKRLENTYSPQINQINKRINAINASQKRYLSENPELLKKQLDLNNTINKPKVSKAYYYKTLQSSSVYESTRSCNPKTKKQRVIFKTHKDLCTNYLLAKKELVILKKRMFSKREKTLEMKHLYDTKAQLEAKLYPTKDSNFQKTLHKSVSMLVEMSSYDWSEPEIDKFVDKLLITLAIAISILFSGTVFLISAGDYIQQKTKGLTLKKVSTPVISNSNDGHSISTTERFKKINIKNLFDHVSIPPSVNVPTHETSAYRQGLLKVVKDLKDKKLVSQKKIRYLTGSGTHIVSCIYRTLIFNGYKK